MRSKLVVPAAPETRIFGLRPERFAVGAIFLLSSTLLAYLGVLVWAYPLGGWGFLIFYVVWYGVSRIMKRRVGPS